MIQKKTLAALEKVIMALAPLDPESRRQVIEATHTLVEISAGRRHASDKRLPGNLRTKGKKR